MGIRGLIRKVLSYNGSMEYQQLSDEVVVSGYQHKYVIEKYLPYFENKKILDAGCWTGPLEKEIANREIAAELVGLDENESALNVARKNFPGYNFVRCGLLETEASFLDRHRGYFDTIVFLDVLEHLPRGSELRVMKLLNSLLKSGGIIIMSTMADNIFNFIDPAWFFGHRHYKLRRIRKIVKESGFEVLELLKIGNLWWDIDLLFFYISKHLFKKKYHAGMAARAKIMQGFNNPVIPTRFYLLARKAVFTL